MGSSDPGLRCPDRTEKEKTVSMNDLDAYRAELDYRREVARRDWRGLRRRRATVRNRIEDPTTDVAS